MTTYTARQLRTIADRLEGFTRARQGGAPVQDVFPVRFPSDHIGAIVWEQAGIRSAAVRAKGEAPWRYVVDLGPNEPNGPSEAEKTAREAIEDSPHARLWKQWEDATREGQPDASATGSDLHVALGGDMTKERLQELLKDMAKGLIQKGTA